MANRQTGSEIESVAALWAVRADDASFSDMDHRELEVWLGGDSRRLGAYARACAMIMEARRIKALGPAFDPNTYSAEPEFPIGVRVEGGLFAAHPTRRRFLAGASVIATLGVGAVIGISWPAAATTYSTRRGEIRIVLLSDGTSMTLNTETTAKVSLSHRIRHVELIEGEIIFYVAPDPTRPFVVEADRSRILAGANGFAVSRLAGKGVAVTVSQGSVRLSSKASATPSTIVQADTRALIEENSATIATSSIPRAQISQDLAWQHGMLSFADTPLRDAAAEFARYSDFAIRFADPAIGNETITGLYSVDDPLGFARSAALSLGLKADAQPNAVSLSLS